MKEKKLICLILFGVLGMILFGKNMTNQKAYAKEREEQTVWGKGNLSDKDIEKYYYPEFYCGYRYPVLPGSSIWPYSNHQDMIDVCQIPSERLEYMSTCELLETVMLYPLLSDVYAYDDISEGIDIVRNAFNGFDELCRRSDRRECMIEWLTTHREWFLEVQSADDVFVNSMLNAPRISFMILAQAEEMGLNQEGNVLGILNEILSDSSDASLSNRTAEPVSYVGFSDYITLSQQTVYTPRGGAMTAVTYNAAENWLFSDNVVRTVISSDLSTEGKNYCTSSMYSRYHLYPDSGRNATVKYNCHSYAWFSTNSTNVNWINSINTSGYYTTTIQNINNGGIVVFCESHGGNVGSGTERKHSAIALSKIYHPVHYNIVYDLNLRSKWGMCGVYSHQLTNCPYYYYSTTTFVSDQLFYN